MIDGIIKFSVTEGQLTITDDTTIEIAFHFPEGYWPISISSKPFSVLPGFVKFADDPELASVCFNSSGSPVWNTVTLYSASMNIGYGYNVVDYNFTFANKGTRDEFIESFFGKGATEDSTRIVTPVSMILVKTLASAEN